MNRFSTVPALLVYAALLSGAPKDAASPKLAQHQSSNPNHLEPIPAYDSEGYDQAVFKSLIGDEQPALWMISKPSVSPERGVMIIPTHHRPDPKDPERIQTTVYIERFEANRQIWKWKETSEGRHVLDIQPTDNVARFRKVIDVDFGNQIYRAWESVLKRTKYPESNYRGADGTTYQFYCSPNLFGEVWTPNAGLPLELVELGKKLEEFLSATEDEEHSIKTECLEIASRILEATKNPEQGSLTTGASGRRES